MSGRKPKEKARKMSGLAETSAEANTGEEPVSRAKRESISVTIVAHNEAEHIGACIDSVSWADEIIIVDAGSTDGTQEICQKRGALIIQHPWQGYAAQKNFAISKASHSWILSLDADECVSPELTKEILSVLSTDGPAKGFRVPRKNIFFGRWLRHGDLWPDYQVRLFRRDAGEFNEKSVHESVLVHGHVGVFSAPLEHRSYDEFVDFIQRQVKYAELSAEDLFAGGIEPGIGDFVIRPLWRFFKSYILKMGLRDGVQGLWVSVGSAYYVFMRAAFLWELCRGRKRS